MRKIELETSVDKFLDVDQKTIPSGTKGTLIDVIIESGTVRFLLDFEQYNTFEWYSINELEERF